MEFVHINMGLNGIMAINLCVSYMQFDPCKGAILHKSKQDI